MSTRSYDLVSDDSLEQESLLGDEAAFENGIVFKVKYIGTMEIPKPSNRVQIVAAMRRIRFEFRAKSVPKKMVNMNISLQGITVKLMKKCKRLRNPAFEDPLTIISHPVYRIFYVSHDSQDLNIFSFIARDGSSNTFKCNVFKSYKKSQATQIVRAVGQTFDVCHRKTMASMAEQDKLKRAIQEDNRCIQQSENTALGDISSYTMKSRELPSIPAPRQQLLLPETQQQQQQHPVSSFHHATGQGSMQPPLKPNRKDSNPHVPKVAEVYPSVVTTATDKMDEQCTRQRFLAHLSKLLEFDQKSIDLNRAQLEHNRVLLENNRTMLECNRITALRTEDVKALITYGDTLLETNARVMTNSEKLLEHNMLLMDHSAKLIKHMHRLNDELTTKDQSLSSDSITSDNAGCNFDDKSNLDPATPPELTTVADVHVAGSTSACSSTPSSSSNSLDRQAKDSGYSLSRLQWRNSSSSSPTHQGQSTLSALIQSHSSMTRHHQAENVSESEVDQTRTRSSSSPAPTTETNRVSPDSGHSGSFEDLEEDPSCPATSELSTSWCTLVASSKDDEVDNSTKKQQMLMSISSAVSASYVASSDSFAHVTCGETTDHHSSTNSPSQVVAPITSDHQPPAVVGALVVDSRCQTGCDRKKKLGFFASFLKPAARRLHRRPLSMPSSLAAALSKKDMGSPAEEIAGKAGSNANPTRTVYRSKSYGDNKLAKLQADKYISDGRAPLISLDCNE